MAKGKLSIQDKIKIQELLNTDITVDDIATQLGRRPVTINKYIENELEPLLKTMVSRTLSTNVQPIHEAVEDDKLADDTIRRLVKAGLKDYDAQELVYSVLDNTEDTFSVNELYATCLQRLSAKHVTIRETAGGREGVAIMTQAASERGDESKRKSPADNPDIYRPYGDRKNR
jgi:IS30 family transposase